MLTSGRLTFKLKPQNFLLLSALEGKDVQYFRSCEILFVVVKMSIAWTNMRLPPTKLRKIKSVVLGNAPIGHRGIED